MLEDRKHSLTANSPITKETHEENNKHLILSEVCKEFSHITQALQPYKAQQFKQNCSIYLYCVFYKPGQLLPDDSMLSCLNVNMSKPMT